MSEISELKQVGLKGSLWNFLTSIISQLRGFIVSIILARLLTPEDFGIVAIAMVFNGLIEVLVDCGFSSAIVQKKDVSQLQKSTIFYINLSLGAIFTTILFVSAPLMQSYFQIDKLSDVVRATSLCFIIASVSTVQTSLFQKQIEFKPIFRARVSSSIVSGIGGILLAFCGFGVWALVISNLISWIFNSLIIWISSTWRPSLMFSLLSVRDLWDYGWKLTLTTFSNRIYTQIDTFIIGKLFMASTLGFYNRAQSLNRLIVDYTFSSIRNVLLPTFSKLQDEKDKLRISVLKLLNVISFLNFLFSGLMFVNAYEIIELLYGKNWIEAAPIFKILAIFSLHLSLPVLYDAIMSSLSRMNMYLWVNILRKPIMLISIPVGIWYGFFPYIWSINILYVVSILPLLWAVKKCIGLGYIDHLVAIIKYFVPCLALLLISLKFNEIIENPILSILIKTVIYGIIYITYCSVFKFEGFTICRHLLKNGMEKFLKKRNMSKNIA